MSLTNGRPVVEAVVQIGSQETPYRRAGRGPAVLLLTESASESERAVLFEGLARRFRVIEPTGAAGDAAGPDGWEGWLRGVIDGLGLDRPTLVVDPAVAPRARAFALADPDRTRAVVVVRPGDAAALIDWPAPAGPQRTEPGGSPP